MTIPDTGAVGAEPCPDFTISIDAGTFTPGVTFTETSLSTDTLEVIVDSESPFGDHTITYSVTIIGQTYSVTPRTFTITVSSDCSTEVVSYLDIANGDIWLTSP